MLPDTLQRRLESIPTLSRQGKRINGLSRLMADPLLWEQVYAEIASNRGALTPGVTDETLDGFSLERIERIIGQITNGSYRFVPVRKALIPKASGKTHPPGIPTASDKLVQAAVKLLLERIELRQEQRNQSGDAAAAQAALVQKMFSTHLVIRDSTRPVM